MKKSINHLDQVDPIVHALKKFKKETVARLYRSDTEYSCGGLSKNGVHSKVF